jgi:hypothetical protein
LKKNKKKQRKVIGIEVGKKRKEILEDLFLVLLLS